MPKSKRSAKRRAKLKKRRNETYAWALRKINQINAEMMQANPTELKSTGWKSIQKNVDGEQDDLQG